MTYRQQNPMVTKYLKNLSLQFVSSRGNLLTTEDFLWMEQTVVDCLKYFVTKAKVCRKVFCKAKL